MSGHGKVERLYRHADYFDKLCHFGHLLCILHLMGGHHFISDYFTASFRSFQ